MYSLVSIIMPCYNGEKYIEKSILSVLKQSYHDWELIIVDDNSNDSTYLIISNYLNKDTRIQYIKNNKNIGVALTRNKGIKKAKGDFIAFLDNDDIWLENKLEKQLNMMHNENILLSYSSYYTIDEEGETLSLFYAKEKVTYPDMLKTSTIGTLTTIYNAKELGKFYMSNTGHEDYILKLQILKQVPYAKGILEPLAKYRIHRKSLSSNKLHAAKWQWHIYRKIEKISLFKSIYYFLHYTFHGIFKYR